MTISERPGVYTYYEIAESLYGSGAGAAVGLVAEADRGEDSEAHLISDVEQAKSIFGGGNMIPLVEILLRNGAPRLYCVACGGDYEACFETLMAIPDIRFMVCDSRESEYHEYLRDIIAGGDEKSKYRIGIIESAQDTANGLISAARGMNSERIVMVSHHEVGGIPGSVAAAVCGVAASGSDPAVPLNGAQLLGLGDIGGNFSDGEISNLILGGVTPIESVFGGKSIVRGVTTRTQTAGTADPTWREVNTVMIIDHMMPALRDSLRLKFARAKNTAQTRGAIRSHMCVELEEYKRNQIIDDYGDISVTQSENDPTVCVVNFAFTVAHGLNKIELRAHITV